MKILSSLFHKIENSQWENYGKECTFQEKNCIGTSSRVTLPNQQWNHQIAYPLSCYEFYFFAEFSQAIYWYTLTSCKIDPKPADTGQQPI